MFSAWHSPKYHYRWLLVIALILPAGLVKAVPISGIINSYAAVTSIAGTNITVNSATGFAVGDKIMIIQMKGVSINQANASTYGDITAYNDCGNFEFAYIASIAGNTITLQSNLVKTYTVPNGEVQLVTIPFYCDAEITDTLKAKTWDGSSGGILIFESGGTVTMNADIYVSGAGFQQQAPCNTGTRVCGNTAWFINPNSCASGRKGEGVFEYFNNAQSGGRAKLANGGGGSNHANSGGGGGANYGAGGLGGSEDNFCGINTIQGIGGASLDYTLGRLFLGGAGGNGQGNNSGAMFAGGSGGGIVIISAKAIVTNGHTIWNDGKDVTGLTVNEGAGGGGGGGVVCLDLLTITGILNVQVNGGDGGSTNNDFAITDCTGPGGGGGAGAVWVSGGSLNPNIVVSDTGGAAGLSLGAGTSCINTTYGATNGTVGSVIFNYPPHILPPPATVANLGPDTLACPLQVLVLFPGTGLMNYLWQDGTTNATDSITGPGTYYVQVTDSLGCLSSDTIIVNATPPFSFSIASGDTIVCPSQSVTIDPGSFTSYLWQDSTTNATYFTSDTGTYVVTVTDSIGCTGSASYQVFNIPPFFYNIGLTGDTIVCPDAPIDINAGSGYASYTWQDSSTGQFFSTTDTGIYTVIVVDSLGCSGTGTYHVGIFANSVVFLGNDTAMCEGDSMLLDAGIFPQYLWSTGSLNKSIAVTDTGTYYVTIIDFNGCTISDTISIDSFYTPPPADLISDTTVCTGATTTVLAPAGYATYLWDDGSTLNYRDITDPGSYSLTVTNQFTCAGSDTFNVTLRCPTSLFVPDAFTPNGDGVNDVFIPIGYNITSFLMQIYNRWGTKEYETHNISDGWYGDCRGVPCEMGSYVYYIEWTGTLDGVSDSGVAKGNVTLIR